MFDRLLAWVLHHRMAFAYSCWAYALFSGGWLLGGVYRSVFDGGARQQYGSTVCYHQKHQHSGYFEQKVDTVRHTVHGDTDTIRSQALLGHGFEPGTKKIPDVIRITDIAARPCHCAVDTDQYQQARARARRAYSDWSRGYMKWN